MDYYNGRIRAGHLPAATPPCTRCGGVAQSGELAAGCSRRSRVIIFGSLDSYRHL